MNPRYKETFSSHRVLFSIPVALATIVALWYVLGSPKQYESATSLWVDTPPPGLSSLENTNTTLLTPSAQAQQLLSELLTTRHFRLAIGQEGPLEKYLATHSATGWGPRALLKSLRGSGSVDDRVVAELGPKNVLTTIAGPQVLGVTVRGPAPSVAVGTLQALVDQLNVERRNFDISRNEASMAYYRNQVDAATAGLKTAQSNLANGAAPGSTADLHTLAQAEHVAAGRLKTATRAFNQAALNLAASHDEQGMFKVIDPIKLPAKPVKSKKKMIFALVAGLFVGGLISFLGIVALSGREERRLADLGRDSDIRETTPIAEPAVAGANGSPTATARVVAAEPDSG